MGEFDPNDLTFNPSYEDGGKPEWLLKEKFEGDIYCGIEVTAPSGFLMHFPSEDKIFDALFSLSLRGSTLMPGDTSVLKVAPDGEITVIDCDVWINPGFEFGTYISNASALAYVLIQYLNGKRK